MRPKRMAAAVIMTLWTTSHIFAQVPILPPAEEGESGIEPAKDKEKKSFAPVPPLKRTSIGLIEAWEDGTALHAKNRTIHVALRLDTLGLEVRRQEALATWRSVSNGRADLMLAMRGKTTPIMLSEAQTRHVCFIRVNKTGGFEVLLTNFRSVPSETRVEIGLRVMLEQEGGAFTVAVLLYPSNNQTLGECRYPSPLVGEKGAMRRGGTLLKDERQCMTRLTFDE